jgi:hypothetical protein
MEKTSWGNGKLAFAGFNSVRNAGNKRHGTFSRTPVCLLTMCFYSYFYYISHLLDHLLDERPCADEQLDCGVCQASPQHGGPPPSVSSLSFTKRNANFTMINDRTWQIGDMMTTVEEGTEHPTVVMVLLVGLTVVLQWVDLEVAVDIVSLLTVSRPAVLGK